MLAETRSLVDIGHLREFVLLATTLNLTSAARELHLVPSTLSKHVSRLEAETGLKLLKRTSTSVELTPEGKLFFEGAASIVDCYDRTIESARKSMRQQTGVVLVGGHLLSTTIEARMVWTQTRMQREESPIFVQFYGPHASGNLFHFGANDPLDVLRKGLIDVAIMHADSERDWGSYVHRSLYRERFSVFVPESHPLASGQHVTLSDLKNETFVLVAVFRYLNECLTAAFRRAGVCPRTIPRIAGTFSEFLAAAKTDEVLCVVQSIANRVPPKEASGLVQLQLDDPAAYADVSVVSLSKNPNPALPVFLDALDAANRALIGTDQTSWVSEESS